MLTNSSSCSPCKRSVKQNSTPCFLSSHGSVPVARERESLNLRTTLSPSQRFSEVCFLGAHPKNGKDNRDTHGEIKGESENEPKRKFMKEVMSGEAEQSKTKRKRRNHSVAHLVAFARSRTSVLFERSPGAARSFFVPRFGSGSLALKRLRRR